jgi:translation initiation factor 5A
VTHVSTSKTGKHGHAKCNFTAIDIFNGKKHEDIIPSTHNTDVPFVTRKEYSLLDISSDGFVTLMDAEGTTREDIKLPEWPDSFAREISTTFEAGSADNKSYMVVVLSAMGHDQIVEFKEEQQK